MSQSGVNTSQLIPVYRKATGGMLGGIVFFIVICIVLYYVYTFLYSSTISQASINIVPSNVLDKTKVTAAGIVRCDAFGPVTGTIGPGTNSVAQVVNAKGLTSGGQYTVTMWLSVYSTTPQTSGTGVIPLLDISSTAKTLLFIGLTPTNGTLIVNQGTGESDDGTVDPLTGLTGYTDFNSTYGQGSTSSDKCNIVNGIEYQRWILIGVVANGRTLDVYIDGKLSRSCVYKGLNDLGVSSGTGTLTVGRQSPTAGTINGVYSTTDYFNYALTPDLMWSIYQNGPGTVTGSFFSSLFNTNIDLSLGSS